MSLFKSKTSFLLSLFLYTLILTGLLLYFRFPAEKFKTYCEVNLSKLMPGTECSIDRIHYSFPCSLAAETIRISSNKLNKQELFTIEQALISPDISALTSQLQVKLSAFAGIHTFSLMLGPEEKEFTLKDIQINNLDPSRIPFLGQATKRKIVGNVDGSGHYHGIWKNGKYSADGAGQITLQKGSFSLLLPIFSLNSIDLKKLTSNFVLKENTLECSNGTFYGQELKGSFSGSLSLKSTLKAATLSFKGALEPLPPLLKKNTHAKKMLLLLKKQSKRGTVPFLLKGTVQKPSFKFES
ncbi:MAG TPA: type II secretion system protein GspN [Desulfocapsa sulfexigens]|nr:type II secretion system protein GspN [Desulfocapsa sulfexigens]